MNAAAMPDVSRENLTAASVPLKWVGMRGIDLPVVLDEPGCGRSLHARADIQVDLPLAHVKGIHMSRLYQLLESQLGDRPLVPGRLPGLLEDMIASHGDCGTRRARLRLAFDILVRRPALVSEGVAGWKSYPAFVEAQVAEERIALRAGVQVEYSSTCPCSAALSRQLVERHFRDDFAGAGDITVAAVADWLKENASLATPHSQRSQADVSVGVGAGTPSFGFIPLIDRVEQALGTPTQTAVRRADEQAFARLNGENLMFVEDAARRIEHALVDRYAAREVKVRHLESLHPHDAVA
ncbi:MAG: GTP cyclohydrolase FolE2 [Gammaproteobacteria bacterium]